MVKRSDQVVVKPHKGLYRKKSEALQAARHVLIIGHNGKVGTVTRGRYDRLVQKVAGTVSGRTRSDLLDQVRQGLPFAAFEALEEAYQLPRKEMAAALSISTTTLNRRQKTGVLSPEESDRVARFARLKDLVVEMMDGSDEAAVTWLKTPRSALGDETPLQRASTELGARDVEDLIGRIEHGVFS